MIRRKIQKYIALALILTSFLGASAIHNHNVKQETKQYTKTIVIDTNENEKVLEKKVVVEAINELSNLEILQMQLNKQVKITKGEFFKKEKEIKFSINGKYILNLNSINPNNIIINGNEILIFCSEPSVEVNFNESQTQFSETEKAFYTIGDIKLTVEEIESIKAQLKESIIVEMNRTTNMNIAKEKASKSIENTISKLTKSEYSVEVRWVI